jgi:hypothetical protein
MADDFKVILTTAVPGLSTVRLYDETIHHVNEEHREVQIELPSMMVAIENAIKNPTSTEPSYANSVVFVDDATTNYAGDPLRIPVKRIAGTDSGRIKTIFFASTDTKEADDE